MTVDPAGDPNADAPMREALNGLQELLGSINDHATATELIAVVGRRARGSLQPQARLILEHWNEALLAEQRRALKPAWKRLRACAPTETIWLSSPTQIRRSAPYSRSCRCRCSPIT